MSENGEEIYLALATEGTQGLGPPNYSYAFSVKHLTNNNNKAIIVRNLANKLNKEVHVILCSISTSFF